MTDTATVPETVHAPASRRALLRTAGLGGLVAFFAWAAQPVVVAIAAATAGEGEPDWAVFATDRPFAGAIGAVIFTGVGVGFLLLVLAVNTLVTRGGGRGVGATAGQVMGVGGALAWLLVAGASLGPFTSVGAGVPDVAPDSAVQRVVVQQLGLDMTGTLVAQALLLAGWALMLATAGRRSGVVGIPLAVVCLLAVAGVVVQFVLPFSPPWALLGSVALALVLGVALLVKAVRTPRDAMI